MGARRRQVAGAARERAARSVHAKLETLGIWTSARRVVAYAALADELAAEPIAAAAAERGLALAWPRLDGALLEFAESAQEDLVPGPYGVLAPPSDAPAVTLRAGDLVVVPGVAFDASGRRLGRGGGHYDRALASLPGRATSVGIGYDFQLVGSVPVEAHDVAVDLVITDRRIHRRGDA